MLGRVIVVAIETVKLSGAEGTGSGEGIVKVELGILLENTSDLRGVSGIREIGDSVQSSPLEVGLDMADKIRRWSSRLDLFFIPVSRNLVAFWEYTGLWWRNW